MEIRYRQPELHLGLSTFTMDEVGPEAPSLQKDYCGQFLLGRGSVIFFSDKVTDVLCLLPNTLPPTVCHVTKLCRLCAKGRQEHSGGLLRSVPGERVRDEGEDWGENDQDSSYTHMAIKQ